MDYCFTDKEILVIHHALRMRREYYAKLQNSKDNRKHVRETESVILKLESQDPALRLALRAESLYPCT